MILIVLIMKFTRTESRITIQYKFFISVVETPVAEQYCLPMSCTSLSKRPQNDVVMRYIERLSSSIRYKKNVRWTDFNFRTSRRFFFHFIISLLFRISWLVTSLTLMPILSRMMILVSERLFFLRMISCYPISRSKCLGWMKRLRDDDRDNLLTSNWTKIVDRNHHYQSVPDIQIFTIAILFTVESWYTISWHRNYRRGPTQIFTSGDLDIVKEWHSLSTADIDALTDGPGRPLTNDHDIMVILFLYRISLINIIEVSYCNRSWLRVCRKNMFMIVRYKSG